MGGRRVKLYLGHVRNSVGVVHQLALVHFDLPQRVDGQQELALVRPHSTGHDAFHQFRVLVDEPSLAQNVGRRVLQLQMEMEDKVQN